MDPHEDDVERLIGEGLAHQQAGRLAEADEVHSRILQLRPGNAVALRMLAASAARRGQRDRALELIRAAVESDPDSPIARLNLGEMLWANGQIAEARQCFAALAGRHPALALAHYKLGLACWQSGRTAEGVTALRGALDLAQPDPALLLQIASSLREIGELRLAAQAYRRAIEISPLDPQLDLTLGQILFSAGDGAGAIETFRNALARLPEHVELQNELGIALLHVGDADGAIDALQRALALNPAHAAAMNNLGNALSEVGRVDESVAAHRRAVELAPADAAIHSNLVCTLLYHPHATHRQTLEAAEVWAQRHADPLAPPSPAYANRPDPLRRLRIGYVSPDFRHHVVARNIMPLFKHHDRQQFHITCYHNNRTNDAMTGRFRALCDQWRDISRLDDQRAADAIRSDEIDVLVDLAVHTSGNRLPVLARRPAPVQVTFAGYPGTTGMRAIDYRLTDRFLDPEDPQRDASYVERPLRLESFWCYEPDDRCPDVNDLPAIAAGVVTFGCLNRFAKVNEEVIELWSRVLHRVPRSRMIILSPQGRHREALVKRMGVETARVEFVPTVSRRQYLAQYHRIDMCLDTFTYNGHTTALDAMWMGVPTVTLCGETAVSRAGLSQLSNVGLTDLVAFSPQQFVAIATALANDLPRLAEMRTALRGRMQRSVLNDAAKFARDIEAMYRLIWRRWCDTRP